MVTSAIAEINSDRAKASLARFKRARKEQSRTEAEAFGQNSRERHRQIALTMTNKKRIFLGGCPGGGGSRSLTS